MRSLEKVAGQVGFCAEVTAKSAEAAVVGWAIRGCLSALEAAVVGWAIRGCFGALIYSATLSRIGRTVSRDTIRIASSAVF